jgi:hypothetical protein
MYKVGADKHDESKQKKKTKSKGLTRVNEQAKQDAPLS